MSIPLHLNVPETSLMTLMSQPRHVNVNQSRWQRWTWSPGWCPREPRDTTRGPCRRIKCVDGGTWSDGKFHVDWWHWGPCSDDVISWALWYHDDFGCLRWSVLLSWVRGVEDMLMVSTPVPRWANASSKSYVGRGSWTCIIYNRLYSFHSQSSMYVLCIIWWWW